MNPTTETVSAQSIHKFVWPCLGVLTLFIVTTPIAIVRVSQMDKFKGSHVKSLTDEWKVPAASHRLGLSAPAHP